MRTSIAALVIALNVVLGMVPFALSVIGVVCVLGWLFG